MKNIAILGSTGSIGTQTLDVVDKLDLKVSALTAANNITLLEQQVRKYKKGKGAANCRCRHRHQGAQRNGRSG